MGGSGEGKKEILEKCVVYDLFLVLSNIMNREYMYIDTSVLNESQNVDTYLHMYITSWLGHQTSFPRSAASEYKQSNYYALLWVMGISHVGRLIFDLLATHKLNNTIKMAINVCTYS